MPVFCSKESLFQVLVRAEVLRAQRRAVRTAEAADQRLAVAEVNLRGLVQRLAQCLDRQRDGRIDVEEACDHNQHGGERHAAYDQPELPQRPVPPPAPALLLEIAW